MRDVLPGLGEVEAHPYFRSDDAPAPRAGTDQARALEVRLTTEDGHSYTGGLSPIQNLLK